MVRKMSNGKPRVCIGMPVYNGERFLKEAVDSISAQTFEDFEIIIVNDGSSDPATNELLADYQKPKTTVIHVEHGGLACARNLAVKQSRGKYLCALDADDRLHPAYFEKATALLEQNPDLTFVSSWLEAFGEEQWIWQQDSCDLVTLLAEEKLRDILESTPDIQIEDDE